MWLALLNLYLLSHEIFFDSELFTSRELPDACMEISLNEQKSTPENVPKLERLSTPLGASIPIFDGASPEMGCLHTNPIHYPHPPLNH